MTTHRRTFILQCLSGSAALMSLAVPHQALAQGAPALTEGDPQAVALGYKTDGAKADTKKYPSYAVDQSCSGCALFQGKATDPSGSCAVFGNRMVASKGWCSVWAKKA